jgi:hypothetical protein
LVPFVKIALLSARRWAAAASLSKEPPAGRFTDEGCLGLPTE